MSNVASIVGVLHHCRAVEIYKSTIIERGYYTTRGVMLEFRDTGEEKGVALAQVSYMAYQSSFMEGVLFELTMPIENNAGHRFDKKETKITTEAQCKDVEKRMRFELDDKNGYLYGRKEDRSGLNPNEQDG